MQPKLQSMKYDYLIVGAGLFGATFAYLAKKAGKTCIVIDKRNHIGGNLYCKEMHGITVHMYGPHIFHTNNKSVYDFVTSLVNVHPYCHQPIAMYNDKLYNLPFNMNTFYQMWGVKTEQEAINIIKEQSNTILNSVSLRDKAISMVGADIYHKLIEGYTEKQWGAKCENLPASIIKRLPVRFTFDNRYFSDIYEFIPDNGYNSLFDKLLEDITVLKCVPFNRIKNEWRNIADKLLFTGRIDSLFDYKYGELPYRSLRFKHTCQNTNSYQCCAVMNYTSAKVPYTRTVEHRFFEPSKEPLDKTIVTFEYPNGLSGKDVVESYYPINTPENESILEKYKEELRQNNDILVGGRLGSYRYYDMDDTILSAFELAKKELNI